MGVKVAKVASEKEQGTVSNNAEKFKAYNLHNTYACFYTFGHVSLSKLFDVHAIAKIISIQIICLLAIPIAILFAGHTSIAVAIE